MNSLIDNSLKENIETTILEQQNDPLIIIHIQLRDGTYISERFYTQVLQLISDIEPVLEVEPSYTAKMLCGKEFWKSLEKGERIIAGKCIAHAVACGDLPLCFAGTTSSNSQLYKLK